MGPREFKKLPQPENVLVRTARRLVVAVVGTTVLLVGTAMIFLPGPAVVVMPLGLAILATEFVWARRILKRVKRAVQTAAGQGLKQPAVSTSSSDRDRTDPRTTV